jgi:F-type H+-transporting ATPase subunit a
VGFLQPYESILLLVNERNQQRSHRLGLPPRKCQPGGNISDRPLRCRARSPERRGMKSPLTSIALFHLGPMPITASVVATWAIMVVLVLGSVVITRRLSLVPSSTQAFFELIVDTVDSQIRDTMQVEPGPYRAFIGTLFALIFVANWSSLVPGVEPPTAHIETDAALALLVFVAVIWFGVRAGGVRGYLATFASPNPIMIPLNFIESITRTFSLLVRLFGNVMSGVFVVGIVLSLAGLLVPIPLMALDLLTGAVQAYIFAILAMAFIAAAVNDGKTTRPERTAP